MTFEYSFNPWPGFSDPLVIVAGAFLFLALAALGAWLAFRRNKKLQSTFSKIILVCIFGATVTGLFITYGGTFEASSRLTEKIEESYGIEINRASERQFFDGGSPRPIIDVPLNITLEFEGKRYVTTVVLESLPNDEWRLLAPSSSLAELTPLDDLLASGAQELRVLTTE